MEKKEAIYLRSFQLIPELVHVRDNFVPVSVRSVQSLLHLLQFVVHVLILGLCAFQLCP